MKQDKYFTFIGPIAAGKGTQAKILSEKYGLLHLSTGHIFREAIESKSELGLKVKNIIDSGFLVPDAVTNEVVFETLKNIDLTKGFILDGYPRTINQAITLEDMLSELNISLTKAVMINISEDETIKRISGRFICSKCGFNYHDQINKPEVDGVCDKCQSTDFTRRNDDKPEVIKTRLKHYLTEITPIIDFYKQKGLLFEIEATNKTPQEITEVLEEELF